MNDLTAVDPHARVAALLHRAGPVEDPPPPRVWSAVERDLSDPSAAPVVPLVRPSRRRTGPQLVAAAAVGALLTWGGLSLLGEEGGDVVASGPLAPLTDTGVGGSVSVVETAGGQRLRVELDDLPDAGDGYLEVWLLRPDVSGMVTLGVLDGTTAEFPLPAGLDLGDYPVVDISREHMDGDPGHGGDSLVRGEVATGAGQNAAPAAPDSTSLEG
ncbi:hypothetical protein GCM10009584_12210 [Ornithinimicrobium humiphilum]|uniref:Anti-sigma-K factor rskA n=1 Tax=Ornithinimicrobium humiphilum TaxID=125288 RepID=A0A543KJU0_9MICO|nr:anti-sigma factor [Ornithinimicrobium humiphilum]TQM95324.1 anti-sigma-K factor rskA [Ornithinimicrobium humiphilum]